MTIFLSNRDGDGKTSEEGHYKFQTSVWSGNILGQDGLKVTQSTPQSMNVQVAPGQFKIDTEGEYSYTGWNTSNASVSIPTADSANARISIVVVYVDKSAQTDPTPPNNPGIVKLVAISGEPSASPTAPTDATIQSEVGMSNPFIKLAKINVPAGANTILNPYITDIRKMVTLPDSIIKSSKIELRSNPAAYPVGSLYFNASVNTNPSTLLGFGTWQSFGAGRVLIGFDDSNSNYNQAEKTGGSETHTHTLNNAAAQIGARSGQPNTIGYRNRDIGDLGGSVYNISSGNVSGSTRSHNTALTGKTDPGQNLQPYITVFIWKRTA